MTVAITGANGFVGSLIASAVCDGNRRGLVRNPAKPGDVPWQFGQTVDEMTRALRQCDATTLIHAAWDMTASRREDVDAVCVAGSRRLLQAARDVGIRRVIFISTISAFDGAVSVYGQTKREIERDVSAAGGIVLRLGLVHDDADGGMLGALRSSIRRSRIVPMIGLGRSPQYLLSSACLRDAIGRAAAGDLDTANVPITLADSRPISFAALLTKIAVEEQRSVFRLPLPASFLWFGLRCAEGLGLRLRVRSDSVVSFVHFDRAPDFSQTRKLGLLP